jgi:hypothetical protein
VGTAGQTAKAVIEQAHAILCERQTWVLNEKRIVGQAGLGAVEPLFAAVPADPAALPGWVERVRAALPG